MFSVIKQESDEERHMQSISPWVKLITFALDPLIVLSIVLLILPFITLAIGTYNWDDYYHSEYELIRTAAPVLRILLIIFFLLSNIQTTVISVIVILTIVIATSTHHCRCCYNTWTFCCVMATTQGCTLF